MRFSIINIERKKDWQYSKEIFAYNFGPVILYNVWMLQLSEKFDFLKGKTRKIA